MAKLSKEQIDELKNLGLITSVDQSTLLANADVDQLKNLKYIGQVIPSDEIEDAVGGGTPVESIELEGYIWEHTQKQPSSLQDSIDTDSNVQIQLLTEIPTKPESGSLYYILANTLPEGSDKNLTWSISSGNPDNVSLDDNVIYVKSYTRTDINITATASNGVSKTIVVNTSYNK